MKRLAEFSAKNSVRAAGWTLPMAIACAMALGVTWTASSAQAQSEKRTVYSAKDFHWQGNLQAGQTLEIINRNGEIQAAGTGENSAKADAMRRDGEDHGDVYFEVVENSDGATICAVYSKDKSPGRCHRGGISDDWMNYMHWHRDKISVKVQVPRGVKLSALTTNGNVHCRDMNSVVEAATTNGNVEVSTSEWASAKTTNGGVSVSMGSAKWSGELQLHSTNGSIDVTLPASAEFEVRAATTNGGVHSDFPVTVQGSFSSKGLNGKVGAGGRELHVSTTNGGIELKKS